MDQSINQNSAYKVKGELHPSFLQSKEWIDFQKLGNKESFFISSGSSQVFFIKNNIPFGWKYLYAPKGPVGKSDLAFWKECEKLAKEQNCIFLRVEPEKIEDLEVARQIFQVEKSINIQPAQTSILDLNQTEEDLLAKMHSKTRYNIRLAEKKELEIKIVSSQDGDLEKYVNDFLKLLDATATRDGFGVHDDKYYLEMMKAISWIKLYLAYHENIAIAGIMVSSFGDTATYLHGASANQFRNLMAPYLLQWLAIKDSKNQGFKFYDFWGVAPENEPNHPWVGITRFKNGFGGKYVTYPGTYDLIVNKTQYNLYKLVRKIRRII